MSEQTRSSSAVRNLRSIFENKANADQDDQDARGRSPSSRVSASSDRPLSKIRASFINVQHPTMSSSPPPKEATPASTKRASAFEVRTHSFTSNDFSPEALSALKKEISNEQERRQSNPNIVETEGAVESVAGTPAVEVREDQAMGVIDHAATKLKEMELPPPDEEDEIKNQKTPNAPASEKKAALENEPPANPDKPVTGIEEEQGAMKPALPDSEGAVSGGQALPPVAEDLRPQNKAAEATPKKAQQVSPSASKPAPQPRSTPQKSVSKPATNTGSGAKNPGPIALDSAQKAPDSNPKSPTADSKSPSSTKSPLSPIGASKQAVNRKTSRSSLTAPTAASSARGRRESNTVKPASKPRETTKPVSLPSHLTAPTAASRARHEADSAASKPSSTRPAASTRAPPKPPVSTSRPAARSSTAAARPESRTSTAPRKSTTTAPSDGSFLERMMRPTASSAQKTHDKTAEAKSPPRRTKSVAKKPAAAAPTKVNGTAKPAPKAGAASKPLSSAKAAEAKPVEEKSVAVEEKTADEKPAEIPVETASVAEEKANEAPADTAPAATEPVAEEKPAIDTPVEQKPTEEEKPTEQQTPAPTAAETPKQEESQPLDSGKAEPTEIPDIPVPPSAGNGHATPQHAGAEKSGEALESTPAFGEESIR